MAALVSVASVCRLSAATKYLNAGQGAASDKFLKRIASSMLELPLKIEMKLNKGSTKQDNFNDFFLIFLLNKFNI